MTLREAELLAPVTQQYQVLMSKLTSLSSALSRVLGAKDPPVQIRGPEGSSWEAALGPASGWVCTSGGPSVPGLGLGAVDSESLLSVFCRGWGVGLGQRIPTDLKEESGHWKPDVSIQGDPYPPSVW